MPSYLPTMDSPNDDLVSIRDKENDFRSSNRTSKFSYLENLKEKSDDSDVEGDLADPYGPYSLFAKYLKPEKKSRKKFSKNELPKGVSSRNNGDWQRRLRFSENHDDIESRVASKYGLNKTLFSPEKSPKPLSERHDFRPCEKEENLHRKDVQSRYDVRAYEKGENSYTKKDAEAYKRKRPLSERYDRNERDGKETTRPLLERYDIRNSEREEKKMGGDRDVVYEPKRPQRSQALSYEKEETLDFKKDRRDLEHLRRLSERYDFCGYRVEDLKRDRKDLDADELPRPVSERRSRLYDTDRTDDGYELSRPSDKNNANKNEDFQDDRGDHDSYEPVRSVYERYGPGSRNKDGKKIFKKDFRDRELSSEKTENEDLKKGRKDYEDRNSDDIVKTKKSSDFERSERSQAGLYSDAELKSGKPFYEKKVEKYDKLSDDESFAELLDKFHIGPYLQKAISLTKKSLSPKSGSEPNSLTAPNAKPQYRYSPSELSGKYSQTKSPEIDFEKKRLSRYFSPDDSDEACTPWKGVPRDTVFPPDNTIKTLSSDNVSFGRDSHTKWTRSPDDRKADKTNPRADESQKNLKVGSLKKDLNDGGFDISKRKADIEKGDAASSIDNLALDLEIKRVGYETSIEKGFASIGWSGRYNTAQEYSDLDGISQTADSEEKAPPAHYHLPYVAVKRLTLPQAAPPRSKVRNSVLMAEIDRINHRVRPALGFSAVEHYLNSRLALSRKYGKRQYHMSLRSDVDEESFDSCRQAIMAMREKVNKKEIPLSAMANFDDETRMIRAQTAALLKSVHTPLPRSRPLVLPTPSALMETPIPNRITSDAYIHGLLMPLSKVHTDVASRSFYVENPKPYIGKGHLACVSFAGGRAYARRRGHFDEEPIHPRNVKNDIETLSFYSRARAVAKGEEPGPEPKATPRKSRAYRPNTEAAPAPRPRPAPVPAPARQESVKEAAPAKASEPAPAPEPAAEPVTNGINGEEEDAELARLAEEEAELARMEAELAAKESKKKKPKKQASEDADKAAEEAAKKAAEEAARRAEEEEKARKEAELEAELERQVAAELAAEEEQKKKKKEAELEAELERQVAAELAAEEEAKKRAEEEAEIERQVAAELAAEEAARKEAELEAEIERQVAAELAAEEEKKQAESEPEVSNQEEAEHEPEADIEPDPWVEPESEVEPAEVDELEKKSEGEPEPLSEPLDDEPVVDEPLSQAEQDKSVNFWDADDDAAKVDELDPLPED